LKVDRELKEAIQKHGEVQPARKYEDIFHERVNQKKSEIASLWKLSGNSVTRLWFYL